MADNLTLALRIRADFQKARKELRELSGDIRLAGGSAEKTDKPVLKVSQAIDKTGDTARKTKKPVREVAREIDRAGDTARKTKKPVRELGTDIKRTGDSARRAATQTDRLSGTWRRSRRQAAAFARNIQLMAAALVSIGSYKALQGIKDSGIEMERAEARFVAATGNVVLARRELEFTGDVAQRLGLDFLAMTDGYSKFAAAARDTKLEGEGSRQVLRGMAAAAAALQLDAEATTGTLRAMEQMLSKGNVQAEELRGQLGERLPGAFNLASEAMGVSTAELNDMLDRGEVLAEDLLPKLADKLLEVYGPDSLTASQKMVGEINRMKNSFVRLGAAVSEAGVGDFIVNAARAVTAVTDTIANKIGDTDRITELNSKIATNLSLLKQFDGLTDEQVVDRYGPRMDHYVRGLREAIVLNQRLIGLERLAIELREKRLDRAFPDPLSAGPQGTFTADARKRVESIQSQIDELQGIEKTLSQTVEDELLKEKFGKLSDEATEAIRSIANEYDQLTAKLGTDETHLSLNEILDSADSAFGSEFDKAAERADRWRRTVEDALEAVIAAERAYAQSRGVEFLEQSFREGAEADIERIYNRMLNEPLQRQIDGLENYRDRLKSVLAEIGSQEESQQARARARIDEEFADAPAGLRSDVLDIAEQIDQRRQLADEARAMTQVLAALRDAELALADPYDQAVAAADRWRQETLETLSQSGQDYEEFADRVEAVYSQRIAKAAEDAAERQLQAATDWRSGAVRALQTIRAEAEDAATGMERVMSRAVSRTEDFFTDLVTGTKVKFGDLISSIAADLVRLQIRTHFTAPFASALSGFFGVPAPVGHTGMIVGQEAPETRWVHPHIFARAPRAHSGRGPLANSLGPDEVPVITEKTEGIFTAGQMKALGGLARRGTQVFIEFVNQGTPQEQVSSEQNYDQAGNLVVRVVTNDIARNGQISETMKQTFGLRRATA